MKAEKADPQGKPDLAAIGSAETAVSQWRDSAKRTANDETELHVSTGMSTEKLAGNSEVLNRIPSY